MAELTWEEIKAQESGTILHDVFDEGLRFIVVRGPCTLCAYIGIPSDHPLAGFPDDLPVNAHGGLTFAGEGDAIRPKGHYWYGWDYGHSGDYSFYYDRCPGLDSSDERKWLVQDVINDSWEAIEDFRSLMRLAEGIAAKAKAEGGSDDS